MSVITYNGITLPYSDATRYSMKNVYDPESQTDWCLTQYDIATQGIINAKYLAILAPDVAQTGMSNPVQILNAIKTRLQTPRKTLSYTFNGVEMIPQPFTGAAGTCDAKNGPQPGSFDFTMLTNETFIFTYSIVAHYWDTTATSGQSKNNPVIYNRWSETAEIDDANYTRRTREGTFAIRSDNSQGLVPDQLRQQMAVVGVPNGFIRESSQYTVQKDGLALQYRIVDKEKFKLPPNGAFRARGKYSTSTVPGTMGIGQRIATCRVTLEGDKNSSQANLVTKGIYICFAKLRSQGIVFGSQFGTFLEEASVEADLYENEVTVNMRVKHAPTTTQDGKGRTLQVWGLNWANIGWTPLSDPGTAAAAGFGFAAGVAGGIGGALSINGAGVQSMAGQYKAYGTAGILLLAAAYYDPSVLNVTLNQSDGQMSTGLSPGQAGMTSEG